MRNRKITYPEKLQLRVPSGFGLAIERCADAENCAPHEYVRRILLAALRAEGVVLSKPGA